MYLLKISYSFTKNKIKLHPVHTKHRQHDAAGKNPNNIFYNIYLLKKSLHVYKKKN